MLGFSILIFIWNARMSWARGAPAGNDPWLANTLEWLTTSPPPVYNFGSLPRIRSERPLRDLRLAALGGDGALARPRPALESGSDLEQSPAAPGH
jgi:heme/copper-type cytochrome/quinol oxidase subunit 1